MKLIWDFAVYPFDCESLEVKSILIYHCSGYVYIVLQRHF